MEPAVAELRQQGFRITTVDVRDNDVLVEKFNIRVVPTFVYTIDGKEVRRQTGSAPAPVLRMLWMPPLW